MQHERAQVVFLALADPTRRLILQRVAADQSVTATRLAAGLSITRQAVTKHLSALAEAGLLTSHVAGRERQYQLQPERLQEVTAWITRIEAMWNARLDALEAHLLTPPSAGPDEPTPSSPGG
jgi:DNA-binding transcriptional ArsR family regulator